MESHRSNELQEVFSLVFKLGFFAFKSIQLSIIFCSFCEDYLLYARFQQNSNFRWKLVCFVDFFNLFLYDVYQNSLCCAILSPFTMTATAYKIWIYGAIFFLFVTHHHSFATVCAVNAAFQKVGMLKITSAVNPRCKYRLNFIPGFGIYKRFVASRILNALIFYRKRATRIPCSLWLRW